MVTVKNVHGDVLTALYEKWWHDHEGQERKYPSKYGYWRTSEGARQIMPDESFRGLAGELTMARFNESIRSLQKDGCIEIFDLGLDLYYVVTEKGLSELAALEREL